MITYKDCFTKNEWAELMMAKEVANGTPVTLKVQQQVFGNVTSYSLYLGNTALIGEGFQVSDQVWPHTKELLCTHFKIVE